MNKNKGKTLPSSQGKCLQLCLFKNPNNLRNNCIKLTPDFNIHCVSPTHTQQTCVDTYNKVKGKKSLVKAHV